MLGYSVSPAEGLEVGGGRGKEFLTSVLKDMWERREVGKHSTCAQMGSLARVDTQESLKPLHTY